MGMGRNERARGREGGGEGEVVIILCWRVVACVDGRYSALLRWARMGAESRSRESLRTNTPYRKALASCWTCLFIEAVDLHIL